MTVGIEKIDCYAGRLKLDAVDLAVARGRDRAYARDQIMVGTRTVLPPFEDAVTLAVNAGKRLLSSEDRESIALLVTATESSVDFGKPISTWVHRFLELPQNCRTFELKHACYGGTAAFKTAAAFVEGQLPPGKKALVISSDCSRPSLRKKDGIDFIGGAAAVAFLVSSEAGVLSIDPRRAGFWTTETPDTFRPTSIVEIGDGEMSVFSYLEALEGAWTSFKENAGPVDLAQIARHIYHAPFPGMTLQAHRTLLGIEGISGKAEVKKSFEAKVIDGLSLAMNIGSSYGASNFLCLLSLLSNPSSDLEPGDRLIIYSYGSGCQGELYEATIGPHAKQRVSDRSVHAHLEERRLITIPEYEALEAAREGTIDREELVIPRETVPGAWEQYQGRGLLVLDGIRGWVRNYSWS
jgi:hydroxymethylglutaryl-CoA synthase